MFPCFKQCSIIQCVLQCGELSLDENVVDEFPYCRERPVVCLDENNEVINDTYCDSRIRPTCMYMCLNCENVCLWDLFSLV